MKKIFNKYNLFINIYISLIINVALACVLPLLAVGTLNFMLFIRGFAIAFTISTLLVLFVPLNLLGDKTARAMGLKEGGVPFRFMSTLVLAAILSLVMSLIMTAVNAGVGPYFFNAWRHLVLYVFLSVYATALIGNFIAFPLAMKLFGPPPAPSDAPEPSGTPEPENNGDGSDEKAA